MYNAFESRALDCGGLWQYLVVIVQTVSNIDAAKCVKLRSNPGRILLVKLFDGFDRFVVVSVSVPIRCQFHRLENQT